MSKLKGKVAVVTGASKGIGAAIAKSLAAEGASVVVNYASSKSGARTVVDSITAAGGKAVAVGGDVSKAAEAAGDYRRRHQELRPARHPGQQLRRLRVRPDRSHHRREVPQDVQHQCARLAAHHAGSPQAHRRGRQHHQYRLRRQPHHSCLPPPSTPEPRAQWTPSPACWRASSDRRRSASTPSTPAWSKPKAHTPPASSALTSRSRRRPDPARPLGSARRYRLGRRLPRFRRLWLAYGRTDPRRRRPPLNQQTERRMQWENWMEK